MSATSQPGAGRNEAAVPSTTEIRVKARSDIERRHGDAPYASDAMEATA